MGAAGKQGERPAYRWTTACEPHALRRKLMLQKYGAQVRGIARRRACGEKGSPPAPPLRRTCAGGPPTQKSALPCVCAWGSPSPSRRATAPLSADKASHGVQPVDRAADCAGGGCPDSCRAGDRPLRRALVRAATPSRSHACLWHIPDPPLALHRPSWAPGSPAPGPRPAPAAAAAQCPPPPLCASCPPSLHACAARWQVGRRAALLLHQRLPGGQPHGGAPRGLTLPGLQKALGKPLVSASVAGRAHLSSVGWLLVFVFCFLQKNTGRHYRGGAHAAGCAPRANDVASALRAAYVSLWGSGRHPARRAPAPPPFKPRNPDRPVAGCGCLPTRR